MLLIGTLFVFGAIALLVLGVMWKEASPMAARMAALRGDGMMMDVPFQTQESIKGRVLGPIGGAIVARVQSMMPSDMLKSIDKKLIQAGQPTTTQGFLLAIVLVEAAMIGFAVTLNLASGGFHGRSLAAIPVCGFIGLWLPKMWLSNRVMHRQKDILRSLPDAFDLITTCAEAGLGLDAALARVAEKVEGPFAEELTITLREVSLGKLRRDALKEMGDRTGVRDLIAFINAIIQAEMMGTSIATVLRVQAEQMRIRRRQAAEQQAYKAPVKMIFPLVLCIFPTLFIVILGPAGIQIFEQLHKNGPK